jgi:hypothetical protein
MPSLQPIEIAVAAPNVARASLREMHVIAHGVDTGHHPRRFASGLVRVARKFDTKQHARFCGN